MKVIRWISWLAVAFAGVGSEAQIMPLSAKLEKLSYHLRGRPLSIVERLSLAANAPGDEAAFLEEKTNEFLASDLFADAFVFWQAERFRMKTFIYNSARGNGPEEPSADRRDSFHNLSFDVFVGNRSWDELLTGKSYRLAPQRGAFYVNSRLSDFDFYSLLRPELPREGEMLPRRPQDFEVQIQETKIDFANDDNRIAGLLTTPRFMARFTTTDVNKNRRRASQIYRLFLCDPMFPVIPEEADRKSKYLDYIYKVHEQVTEEQIENELEAHGQIAACIGCHSKLDPMGKLFQNHALVLHPNPTAGKLVIRRVQGDLEAPVQGLGELASLLTQQPEYQSCQVKTLWRQFIGKNVPLSEEREAQLIGEFERVGRKTKDFMKVLVSQPEFFTPPKPVEEIRFPEVKTLLSRCDVCHSSATVPKFGEFFDQEMTDSVRLQWLMKMKMRVNIPAGGPGKMPMDYMAWPAEDLNLVKRWLNEGAKDAQGQLWLVEE